MSMFMWKPSSHIKVDANVAGEMCENLEKTVGLTARTLVDANVPEDAPLHNQFEWNDVKAADEYRLYQARHIINCLITVPEQSQTPQRAFFNLERKDPAYYGVDVVMRDEDKREKLLREAFSDMRTFIVKYKRLSELSKLIDSMQMTIEELAG